MKSTFTACMKDFGLKVCAWCPRLHFFAMKDGQMDGKPAKWTKLIMWFSMLLIWTKKTSMHACKCIHAHIHMHTHTQTHTSTTSTTTAATNQPAFSALRAFVSANHSSLAELCDWAVAPDTVTLVDSLPLLLAFRASSAFATKSLKTWNKTTNNHTDPSVIHIELGGRGMKEGKWQEEIQNTRTLLQGKKKGRKLLSNALCTNFLLSKDRWMASMNWLYRKCLFQSYCLCTSTSMLVYLLL